MLNVNIPFNEGITATKDMPISEVATIAGSGTSKITITPPSGAMILLSKLVTSLGANCSISEIKIDSIDQFISGEGADSINFMDLDGIHKVVKNKIEVSIANTGSSVECRVIARGLKLQNKY